MQLHRVPGFAGPDLFHEIVRILEACDFLPESGLPGGFVLLDVLLFRLPVARSEELVFFPLLPCSIPPVFDAT